MVAVVIQTARAGRSREGADGVPGGTDQSADGHSGLVLPRSSYDLSLGQLGLAPVSDVPPLALAGAPQHLSIIDTTMMPSDSANDTGPPHAS